MERRDYIMDQIEKIAQLVAALMGKKQIDNAKIEQALTDITGLDRSFFRETNKDALIAIVKVLDDDNKKFLIAELLLAKDADLTSKPIEISCLK